MKVSVHENLCLMIPSEVSITEIYLSREATISHDSVSLKAIASVCETTSIPYNSLPVSTSHNFTCRRPADARSFAVAPNSRTETDSPCHNVDSSSQVDVQYIFSFPSDSPTAKRSSKVATAVPDVS